MFSDAALSILPDRSRKKLEAIIIERNAARAAFLAASDALQEARQEFGLAQGRARERLAMPAGIEADTHPAAALVKPSKAEQREQEERESRLMQPVAAAKRRLDLANDAYERAAARQSSFAYLEGVAAWLNRANSFSGMRLKHYVPAAPKSRDPLSEIQKLRTELAALDKTWAEAENAPCPADELKVRALAEINAIAERGRPSVDPAARAASPINLAAALRMRHEPVVLPGADVPHFALSGDAGAAFWTWLHRDQIAERVISLIDAAAPAEGALTDDERDREFTRISARRLDVERAEESLIVAMEAEGRITTRRRDCDPRAILEVIET